MLRSLLIGVLLPAVLLAGRITLIDGTVYEGEIKKSPSGTSYTVRLTDGTSKIVSSATVKSVDDPALSPATPAAGNPAPPGGSIASGNTPADFAATVRQADKVDSPVFGVALWQKYVEKHPDDKTLPAAKAELDKWQKMVKDGAEKVNGKWVVGDELKKLHDKVDKMVETAREQLTGSQTLKGVQTYRDVLKIYPNSFEANFQLGYYDLKQITRVEGSNAKIDSSIKSLEAAAKMKPNSPATLSNLAIAYSFRRRYEDSVLVAYKAAQLEDSTEIVSNLYLALKNSPSGMLKNNPKIKPIVDDAMLLIGRRGVKSADGWTYVQPRLTDPHTEGNGEGELARRGIVGSGTGFFVTETGYLITNRHVAAAGDKLLVKMSDGSTKVAEKVVVDDEQDVAVLRIKADAPLPFVRVAAYDEPPVGADVTVMGFPLGSMFGTHVKLTRGVVTSIEDDAKAPCDVIVDAQINPGNSGGPMLDKNGNLLALVAMKTRTMGDTVSSYGLGISTKRLRTFFEHQKEKLKEMKLPAPEKTAGPAMGAEEIARKFTPATVMILIVAGDLPDGLKDAK